MRMTFVSILNKYWFSHKLFVPLEILNVTRETIFEILKRVHLTKIENDIHVDVYLNI